MVWKHVLWCERHLIFSCHDRALAGVSPKKWLIFVGKSKAKTVFIRCSHSAIFASVLWVLGTKVPRSYRLLNLATVTVLFPVPGYKSMRQRNLSPDQKDIRVSQLLLKSFQETNRSAGWVGVAVYSKTSALKRISRFLPVNTTILLYQTFAERSYWVPHLEYCNAVFVGLGKVKSDRLEDANYSILRTLFRGLRMKATKAYWISWAWIL